MTDDSTRGSGGPAVRRAAVIGAGAVGCATAGHLVRQGVEVIIQDVQEGLVALLREAGGVRLSGVLEGVAPRALATTDAAEAVAGAQLVVTAVPASAHAAVARAVAPHLAEGAVVLLQPGATLSAVAFLHAAHQAGLVADVTPVETLNAIFTARLRAPGAVDIFAVKRTVSYAALPSDRTAAAGRILEPLFPCLEPASSVLEVSLHNMNAIMHPPVALCNVGPIDRAEPFLFYKDGGTPHVMELVKGADADRLALCEALGVEAHSVRQWYEQVYGLDQPTLYVPYCSLGEVVGLALPTLRSLVILAGALYGRDFWAEGRTLASLGLGGLDRAGLLQRLG
jgi:opine dehydrogenase